VKKQLFITISAVLVFGVGSMGLLAVEAAQTDTMANSEPSRELMDSGIVEEVSSEDLEFYGFTDAEEGSVAGENRFPIRASLTMESYYDSNIFLTDGGETDDFIFELRPRIFYETGDGSAEHYFTVGYAPRFTFFVENSGEDSISHGGFAGYTYTGAKLEFEANHRSAQVEGANNDVGRRVTRNEHQTTFEASYLLSDKFSVDGSAEQFLRFYDSLNNYHNWTADTFLMYQLFPKVKVGLGPKIGWVDIENSPNQSFQQALARVTYEPSPKLVLDAAFGAEFRQYQDPLGADDRITPAASLGLEWLPFDSTAVELEIYRNVSPSVSIIGSNFVATGVRTDLRQRFLQKFYFNLGGGFEHADYRSSLAGGTNPREDYFWFVRPSVDYDFFEYGSASVFFMYEDNVATNSPSDFVRHSVGVQLTFSY